MRPHCDLCLGLYSVRRWENWIRQACEVQSLWQRSAVRGEDVAVEKPGREWGGREQSLTACSIELMFLGSSQSLASLPIPPKRDRAGEGAYWVSEGSRPEAWRALPGSWLSLLLANAYVLRALFSSHVGRAWPVALTVGQHHLGAFWKHVGACVPLFRVWHPLLVKNLGLVLWGPFSF